jgi:aminoglycoside 3-N-acetyltransferase
MIDAEALYVSVGMPINKTVSAVHHAEFLMGVPYRYTKEFVHPCVVNDELVWEEFYLYALRRDVDINRDRNRKIMDAYRSKNTVLHNELGRSSVQSLDLKKFFRSTVNLLTKDIYAWLQRAPTQRESFRV